jgi:DNA-binding Xre family transcriptional regulator
MVRINVRQLASELDWKIADLWKATGKTEKDRVSYNTLILYWHNSIKRVNLKDLVKICDALQCDLDELIEYKHK